MRITWNVGLSVGLLCVCVCDMEQWARNKLNLMMIDVSNFCDRLKIMKSAFSSITINKTDRLLESSWMDFLQCKTKCLLQVRTFSFNFFFCEAKPTFLIFFHFFLDTQISNGQNTAHIAVDQRPSRCSSSKNLYKIIELIEMFFGLCPR